MKASKRSTYIAITASVLFWAVVSAMAWNGFTTDKLGNVIVIGIVSGSVYAVAASGLVVTYTTSGIFNFAQGAMGMVGAFIYWELRFNHGLPTLLALFLSICVFAPLLGVIVERLLMRKLVNFPLVVQLVTTIGLMFVLLGIAGLVNWAEGTRPFPGFFDGERAFTALDTNVSWHQLITILTAAAIAIGLRILLYKTRTGVAMRAVVDNRDLASLNGARADRVSMLAWGLSSSLAAIAGILIAPTITFTPNILALLIINAFAAAIVGRLKSLPMTFLGALLLGLFVQYSTTFLTFDARWTRLQAEALPTIFLIMVLLALPQDRIEMRQLMPARRLFRVPTLPEAALGFGAFLVVMGGLSLLFDSTDGLNRLSLIVISAVMLLSYVPLAGWAGQVSLAQIAFGGVGMWAYAHWWGDTGNPIGFVYAAFFAGLAGIIVALPALRLQGLYLALLTLAVARAAVLFYDQPGVFTSGSIQFTRPTILGFDLTDQRTFLMFSLVLFGILGLAVVAIRRSRFGRRLIAMRDSPAACATLGVNLTITKLVVFSISAAIAGIAGSLSAMNLQVASSANLDPITGLGDVLIIVIGGVGVVSGAIAGGFFFQFLEFLKQNVTAAPFDTLFRALTFLGPGLAAVNIAADPDGAAPRIGEGFGPLLPWRRHEPRHVDPNAITEVAGAGAARGFSEDDVRSMDAYLGVPSAFRVPDGFDSDRGLVGVALNEEL